MVEIQSLGKIKRSLIDEKFGNIQTDDIIVTTERIAQIKQRHPEDYDLFENMALIVYRTRITSYKTENTKEQYLRNKGCIICIQYKALLRELLK